MNQSENRITAGVHHVGLTVAALPEALAFFEDVLGYEKSGEKPDYPAAFVTDGATMITLWQAQAAEEAVAFDRHRNIGLHHLALRLTCQAALDELYERLSTTAGVAIEFAPEPCNDRGARHMMCTIPGGPRLEFRAD
ncbi:MAG: VOC family protein [bacterium]|nr:VOC family protein [bacterium]